MSDFTVRADSVDVEQIMRQIRARIRDKRGVDYTEEQIRELATAKLERFLDPGGVRSGLLEEFQRRLPAPNYAFEDTTLFESDKPLVRFFRKLLRPFLKLQLNPNILSTTLHTQSELNRYLLGLHPIYYELVHNLVLEITRLGIETKNLKMRVESLQSRLEFNERRARALEGVVQYKPESARPGSPGETSARAGDRTEPQGGTDPITGGESLRTRRRRRRRGRRSPMPGGQPAGAPGVHEGSAAGIPDDAIDDGLDDGDGAPPAAAPDGPAQQIAPAQGFGAASSDQPRQAAAVDAPAEPARAQQQPDGAPGGSGPVDPQ